MALLNAFTDEADARKRMVAHEFNLMDPEERFIVDGLLKLMGWNEMYCGRSDRPTEQLKQRHSSDGRKRELCDGSDETVAFLLDLKQTSSQRRV